MKFRLRQLLKPKAQTRKPDVVNTQTNTLFRGEQTEKELLVTLNVMP